MGNRIDEGKISADQRAGIAHWVREAVGGKAPWLRKLIIDEGFALPDLYETEKGPKNEQPFVERMVVKKIGTLAALTGYSVRQIKDFKRDGLPMQANRYPVARIVNWMIERKGSESDTRNKTAADVELTAERIRAARRDNEIAEGLLLRRQDVEHILGQYIADCSQLIDAFPFTVADEMPEAVRDHVLQIVESKCLELRRRLSEITGGLPDPTEGAAPQDDDEEGDA